MALGDSTIVRTCIYRTFLRSKMAAGALVISVLEGQGEKDYGEGMEREKGRGERDGTRCTAINLTPLHHSEIFMCL